MSVNFTLVNWRYAVFHPVWRCDADLTNVRKITCTDWMVFSRENGKAPGDFYQSGHGYGSMFTYNQGTIIERGDDGVNYGNGQSWISLQNNNIGHDPLSSSGWWETIDDGLGAEDYAFTTVGTFPTMTRTLNGKVSYHMYSSASGVNLIRLNQAYYDGQMSQGLGSAQGMAVRMSATEDSCYTFESEADEFNWRTTRIFKVVNGTKTQIAEHSMYGDGLDENRPRICAYGDKIEVQMPSGTVDWHIDPIAMASYTTICEATDSTLSATDYPYVGVRFDGAAGTYLMHEYAGGGFDSSIFASPSTSASISPSVSASVSTSVSSSVSASPSRSISSSISSSTSVSLSASPSISISSSVSPSPSISLSSSPSSSLSVSTSPSPPPYTNMINISGMGSAKLYRLDGVEAQIYDLFGNKKN